MLSLGILLIAIGWCLKEDARACDIGRRGIAAGIVLIIADLLISAVVLLPVLIRGYDLPRLREFLF